MSALRFGRAMARYPFPAAAPTRLLGQRVAGGLAGLFVLVAVSFVIFGVVIAAATWLGKVV